MTTMLIGKKMTTNYSTSKEPLGVSLSSAQAYAIKKKQQARAMYWQNFWGYKRKTEPETLSVDEYITSGEGLKELDEEDYLW